MQGVYLIHLTAPLGNPDSPHGQARHYIGYASDITRRLAHHREGTGARMLAAANERGITWECVRRWPGATRVDERHLKDRHDAPALCPICRRAGRGISRQRARGPLMATTTTTTTKTTTRPTAPVVRTLSPAEITAYHESGHATLALLVGWHVTSVTVAPDRLEGAAGELGRCDLGHLSRPRWSTRQRHPEKVAALNVRRARADLVVTYGGVAGEWVATAGATPDWELAGADMEHVAELVDGLCPGDEDAADALADWGDALARGLLGAPLARAALDVIAHALLAEGTLEAPRLAELVRHVCEAHGVPPRGGLTAGRVLAALTLTAGL